MSELNIPDRCQSCPKLQSIGKELKDNQQRMGEYASKIASVVMNANEGREALIQEIEADQRQGRLPNDYDARQYVRDVLSEATKAVEEVYNDRDNAVDVAQREVDELTKRCPGPTAAKFTDRGGAELTVLACSSPEIPAHDFAITETVSVKRDK